MDYSLSIHLGQLKVDVEELIRVCLWERSVLGRMGESAVRWTGALSWNRIIFQNRLLDGFWPLARSPRRSFHEYH